MLVAKRVAMDEYLAIVIEQIQANRLLKLQWPHSRESKSFFRFPKDHSQWKNTGLKWPRWPEKKAWRHFGGGTCRISSESSLMELSYRFLLFPWVTSCLPKGLLMLWTKQQFAVYDYCLIVRLTPSSQMDFEVAGFIQNSSLKAGKVKSPSKKAKWEFPTCTQVVWQDTLRVFALIPLSSSGMCFHSTRAHYGWEGKGTRSGRNRTRMAMRIDQNLNVFKLCSKIYQQEGFSAFFGGLPSALIVKLLEKLET